MSPLRRALLRWYAEHGRHDFPWRRKETPYRTLVSEFMLQQTQVDRVIPTFEAFLRTFPTMRALAAASRGDVLRAWKGMGYNARAIRLQAAAVAIVREHGGRVPRETGALRALPGIGPYTAAAIRAFAYDLDEMPVDVNVGRVLSRLGERARSAIGPGGNAIASAVMDLGAQVCTARTPDCPRCPVRTYCAHEIAPPPARARRTPFTQTTRYARGRIIDRLRDLAPGQAVSLLDLRHDLRAALPHRSADELEALVDALAAEGLLVLQDGAVSLP